MRTINKPDDNDYMIIEILRRNAKSSLRDIAKIVKMSSSSVKNRIERLVDRGFIRRFTIDVDYRKMGYEIQVVILITSRPGSSEEIFKELHSFTEIFKVYRTAGPANFICIVRVYDMNGFSQFMTEKLEKIEGVERVESMFLMPDVKMDSQD